MKPKKGKAPVTEDKPCSCGRGNNSRLRCKHAACDVHSSSKCTSHNVKNSSVDDRATRFTKSAKCHDCDRSLAAVAHVHCQERADAVVVRCLHKRAPHVGLPWHLLVRGETIAGTTPPEGHITVEGSESSYVSFDRVDDVPASCVDEDNISAPAGAQRC